MLWWEEAILTKTSRLPRAGARSGRWLRAVGQRPPLLSLRREETPGCGGFLCQRRTPQPLPLDTLIFFVTRFSFCFSSLVPFSQGHFHFRLSVSPRPTLTRPLCSIPPFPSSRLGIPGGLAIPAWGPGWGWGSGWGQGREGPVPRLTPQCGKPRPLSDAREAKQWFRGAQSLCPAWLASGSSSVKRE